MRPFERLNQHPTPSISQPQEPSAPRMDATRTREQNVNLGKSVVIKGDLAGSKDLTIEGQVRREDRAAAERPDDWPERQDQGSDLREDNRRARRCTGQHHGHRACGHSRQRVGRRRSLGPADYQSPPARTSGAASTCRSRAPARPRRSPVPRRLRRRKTQAPRLAHTSHPLPISLGFPTRSR